MKPLEVIVQFIIGLVAGIVLGIAAHVDNVNSDCKDYGKYKTHRYMLTCEEVK